MTASWYLLNPEDPTRPGKALYRPMGIGEPVSYETNRRIRRGELARISRIVYRRRVLPETRARIEADRLKKPDPPKLGRKWGEPYP